MKKLLIILSISAAVAIGLLFGGSAYLKHSNGENRNADSANVAPAAPAAATPSESAAQTESETESSDSDALTGSEAETEAKRVEILKSAPRSITGSFVWYSVAERSPPEGTGSAFASWSTSAEDQKWYEKGTQGGAPWYCERIRDPSVKNNCSDVASMMESIRKADPSWCAKIVSDEIRTQCENAIKAVSPTHSSP